MAKARITAGNAWEFGAEVVGCVFDAEGRAAFAVGDGTLRVVEPGASEPRTIEAHKGATLTLALHPKSGFLTGGDDGRLVHTDGDEARELYAAKGRWIENIAASTETGLSACTAGKNAIILSGSDVTTLPHATTAAGVAFDPKGRRLAVAHYNGASLWWVKSAEQTPKTLEWKGSHIAVTWSDDGRFLVTSMQESALHGWRVEDAADMRMTGYPAKIKSWAWDRRGKMLFTSGAGRVIGWPFTGRQGPMGRDPLEVGPERDDALVTVVASSPEIDAIAAGTSDGTVWFEEIGDPGVNYLMLNGAKVTALTFTPDGAHIALGCEDGFAAIVPVA